ncbi:MAG: 4-hydroxybenzoate octaprenyltransferase [Nitrospiraceae bacterium]
MVSHVIDLSGNPSRVHTTYRSVWTACSELIRLRNQSGTWLLMLPSLWSLVLANAGRPPLALLAVFIAGSFIMRSLGVVLNDLADRQFDRQVSRTKTRPLASGALTPRQGWIIAAALLAAAALLVVTLNPLAILLSPVGLLLAALYPYAKRWVQLPQAVLGIAFGWGVVMAWAASRNQLDSPAWALFGATICWAVAYDTIYALQDRADDARIGVKSAAILFGSYTWLAVGMFLAAMLVLLGFAGYWCSVQPFYYVVLGSVGIFFGLQVRKLLGTVPPSAAFTLFKQHVWAGTVILFGMWASVR